MHENSFFPYYFYCCLKLCLIKNTKSSKVLTNSDFFLKEKFMCTSNSHQLWSRNIYDHELMVLSMVPIDPHESSQYFLDLEVLIGNESLFGFAK